jgi:hypothetical protein
MNVRVLFAIIVFAVIAVEIDAKGPFGRNPFRGLQRSAQARALATQAAAKRLLKNPKQMTKRFGPSILVRKEFTDTERSRFVTQPN